MYRNSEISDELHEKGWTLIDFDTLLFLKDGTYYMGTQNWVPPELHPPGLRCLYSL